jgi:hypothetical protein
VPSLKATLGGRRLLSEVEPRRSNASSFYVPTSATGHGRQNARTAHAVREEVIRVRAPPRRLNVRHPRLGLGSGEAGTGLGRGSSSQQ